MTDPTFAYFLAIQIVSVDITVAELASSLGYKRPHIVDQWIAGAHLPEAAMLPRIARVLNVDPTLVALNWMTSKVPELAASLMPVIEQRQQAPAR